MRMSAAQQLGWTCLSAAVCRHPRLSVLACLDLHICLPRGVNQLGRAGMWGARLLGHTCVGLSRRSAAPSSVRVCQRVKYARVPCV